MGTRREWGREGSGGAWVQPLGVWVSVLTRSPKPESVLNADSLAWLQKAP